MIALARSLLSSAAVRFARPLMDRVRFGTDVDAMTRTLREREGWDPARLRAWQLERVRAFLRHAYDQVPFYRRRFDAAGFRPDGLDDLAQLAVLPPLTKEDIRAHVEDLFARDARRDRIKAGRTGGSTGEPTPFFRSVEEAAWHQATVRRCADMIGMRPGDAMVRLGGDAYARNWKKRLYGLYERWLENGHGVSSSYLDAARLDGYMDLVDRLGARVIGGYPSSVYLLACRMVETGRRLPTVRVVWTSSEVLLDLQRERMREAFGVQPFDTYGAGDSPLASECAAHDGLHLFQHSRLIEVVDDAGRQVGPGEEGRVLVTAFHNRDWPYVRYDLGDRAVMGPPGACPCGNRLPRLVRVLGRTGDLLFAPDGRTATTANLTLVFAPINRQVRAYQVAQDALDEVEVRIVPAAGYDAAVEAHVREAFRGILGDTVRVRVRTVEDLPATPLGKRLIVVSSIAKARLNAR